MTLTLTKFHFEMNVHLFRRRRPSSFPPTRPRSFSHSTPSSFSLYLSCPCSFSNSLLPTVGVGLVPPLPVSLMSSVEPPKGVRGARTRTHARTRTRTRTHTRHTRQVLHLSSYPISISSQTALLRFGLCFARPITLEIPGSHESTIRICSPSPS